MTQTIEQLTARIAELEQSLWARDRDCDAKNLLISSLEEENARLKEIEQTNDTLLDQLGDKNAALLDEVASQKHCYAEAVAHYEKQLAASQAYAEQLRDSIVSLGNPWSANSVSISEAVKIAATLPRDTSALDAYVSEKVKEAMK